MQTAVTDVVATEWKYVQMRTNILRREVAKMLEYSDFYDIATYGNNHWRGKFTPKEVACYAYDYWCEFQHSKANGVMTNTCLLYTSPSPRDTR